MISQKLSTNNITKESIFVKGVLFDIDIGYWRGFSKLEARDLDKEDSEIPIIFRLGHKRLLNDEAFKDLATIEVRARNSVERFSFPFLTSRVRFIPYTTLNDLITTVTEFQDLFYKATDIFLFDFELNKENFIKEYPKLDEKLRYKYPDILNLRPKFFFTWSLFEMSIPKNIKEQLINKDQAENLSQLYFNNQSQIYKQLDSWIEKVAQGMKAQIIDSCNYMSGIIKEQGQLRPQTLKKVKENLELLRNMNFLDDSQVNNAIDVLNNSLPANIDRDTPSVLKQFQGVMNNLRSDLSTTSKEYTRKFILD